MAHSTGGTKDPLRLRGWSPSPEWFDNTSNYAVPSASNSQLYEDEVMVVRTDANNCGNKVYRLARAYSRRNDDFGAQPDGEARLEPPLGPRYAAGQFPTRCSAGGDLDRNLRDRLPANGSRPHVTPRAILAPLHTRLHPEMAYPRIDSTDSPGFPLSTRGFPVAC